MLRKCGLNSPSKVQVDRTAARLFDGYFVREQEGSRAIGKLHQVH